MNNKKKNNDARERFLLNFGNKVPTIFGRLTTMLIWPAGACFIFIKNKSKVCKTNIDIPSLNDNTLSYVSEHPGSCGLHIDMHFPGITNRRCVRKHYILGVLFFFSVTLKECYLKNC